MSPDSNGSESECRSTQEEGPVSLFDDAAATWDDKPLHVELAGAVVRAMLEEVPFRPDMQIMDFGCGTGLITRQLAPRVASVTAADTSTEMLAVLARRAAANGLKNVQTLLLETEYPSPAGSMFDAILSSMVLHHIEDIGRLLGRFAEWTRPEGWIALADLEPEDGTFHRSGRHRVHHGFDPSSLARQVETAGFAVKSVRTVHTLRRQPAGATAMREYPVFLLVAQKIRRA
jgi:tRNA (cmo5U34)-methyltransferase